MDADQAFAEAERFGGFNIVAWVSVVTHQANGIASYAAGVVEYHRGEPLGGSAGRFAGPLTFLYSDRTHPEVLIGHESAQQVGQPFSVHSPNRLGFTLVRGPATTPNAYPTVELTALDGSGARHSIHLEQRGGVLIGTGAPAGNLVAEAVYVVTFTKVYRNRPPGPFSHG